MNDNRLENELTEALRGTIDAARKRGYIPTYFLRMLEEKGGRATAEILLASDEPQTGLFELHSLGLLNESLEAVVYQNKKFHVLFQNGEVEKAQKRLYDLNFFRDYSNSEEL